MRKVIGEYSGNAIVYTTKNNGRFILFRAESEREISIDDAKAIQEKEEGRIIAGYSFDEFAIERQNGEFVATWMCYASCDY